MTWTRCLEGLRLAGTINRAHVTYHRVTQTFVDIGVNHRGDF